MCFVRLTGGKIIHEVYEIVENTQVSPDLYG